MAKNTSPNHRATALNLSDIPSALAYIQAT